MRGETLEQHRGGFLETDSIRKRHDAFRRNERMRGIGAGRKDEGDAVAGLDVGYIVADSRNDAGAFKSKRQRQVALVEAAAQLSVEQIDARSLDLDKNLARARHRQRQFFEAHRLGTATLVDADRFHSRDFQRFTTIGRTG